MIFFWEIHQSDSYTYFSKPHIFKFIQFIISIDNLIKIYIHQKAKFNHFSGRLISGGGKWKIANNHLGGKI